MGKQKQPYIPLYVGDYLTDTRILPLKVRGAWMDLILYMWKNEPKGEITHTYEEFSRIFGCSIEETKECINVIIDKKICDCEFLENKSIRLISRKIKSMVEITETRKKFGKRGGNPNLVKETSLFDEAEVKYMVKPILNPTLNQNPEYEYEYENESEDKNENNIVLGGVGDLSIRETFEKFWDTYDKKIGRLNCEKLWIQLTPQKRNEVLEYVPKYVIAKPDKHFRLNPENFLEKEAWTDEIVISPVNGSKNGKSKKITGSDIVSHGRNLWEKRDKPAS